MTIEPEYSCIMEAFEPILLHSQYWLLNRETGETQAFEHAGMPVLSGAGPIMHFEDDEQRNLENHANWKSWLKGQQRMDQGLPALDIDELAHEMWKIIAARQNGGSPLIQ